MSRRSVCGPGPGVRTVGCRSEERRRRLRVCWGSGCWKRLKPPAWSFFSPSPWQHCGGASSGVPGEMSRHYGFYPILTVSTVWALWNHSYRSDLTLDKRQNVHQPVHSAGCCWPAPLFSLHSVASSHKGPDRGQPSGVHLFCITLQIFKRKKTTPNLKKKRKNWFLMQYTMFWKGKGVYTGHYLKQGCQCVLSVLLDFLCKQQYDVMRGEQIKRKAKVEIRKEKPSSLAAKARARSTGHDGKRRNKDYRLDLKPRKVHSNGAQ